MPTSTYVALATTTLGASASSVTFSSIPTSGYRDLILIATYSTSIGDILLEFNSDAGSNYSIVEMRGDGSSAFSASFTRSGAFLGYSNQTVQQSSIAQVMDYSATDKHKTVLTRVDAASVVTLASAGRWASTSAVVSLHWGNDAGTPPTIGSKFSLYGIA